MLALLLGLLLISHAPQTEYGKPEELKGLKKVFVDTGGNMKDRGRIEDEIRRSKIGVELLDSSDGAEVVLKFGGGKEVVGGSLGSILPNVAIRSLNVGEGHVYVLRGGKPKLVMSYEGVETHLWEKKPAKNFGKRFAEAYKKANGLK
ncbi:MAG TPA: hypothetical protein VJT71_13805 [Pyrinomonadaceae bacterium]|nr:hypothetical protein [Pyrinomonadaceae bacterium]